MENKYNNDNSTSKEQENQRIREFMDRIEKDHKIYQKQRYERSEKRHKKSAIRQKRKRFAAFIIGGVMAFGAVGMGVIYSKNYSDYIDETLKIYDIYIDYSEENNIQINEETYNDFLIKYKENKHFYEEEEELTEEEIFERYMDYQAQCIEEGKENIIEYSEYHEQVLQNQQPSRGGR